MLNRKQTFVAAATVALAGHSYAQSSISRTCQSGICYQLNIPDTTASSGNGDIFFAVTAPTKYEWVGIGQGDGMVGANIFVVYPSADGKNVTVSSRYATRHVEPEHNTDAQIDILEGSGVSSNGTMTANVRCRNCNSWKGGSMDFTGPSGSWIHAEKEGTPIMSDDPTAEIQFHSNYGVFDWNFASAKGGNDVNPFVSSNAAVMDSGSGSESSSGGQPPANFTMVQMAHGICAALAFVIFFPIGGILIRVANFPGIVWIHAGIQMLGWALFISAFGMGLWMAITGGWTGDYHPIVGYVVFALLVFQPVGGLLHHMGYKKSGKRSVISYGHIFTGRIAIILGIINGGLGLMFADDSSTGARIAYGVVAGVFGVSYLASAVFGETKKAKAQPSQAKNETYDGRDGNSSEHKSS